MSSVLTTTAAAINAVNIAVGEVALALEADDPRQSGLGLIQDGLDSLWTEATASAQREHAQVAA